MSFIYYKLPYKNKLLEPAVTKQQVSQDKVVFKPRAFQDTCDALVFCVRLQQNWSLQHCPRPLRAVKPLQALTPPGGCRSLCLGAQKDIPRVRGEGWEGAHPLEGSSVWGFLFLAPWTSPVPRMLHHEGGRTRTRHLLRCAVRDELPGHSRLLQD